MADRGMGPSALVSVEPPYDHLFIMARRQLAPSAIFTYDRKWIMTAKQLEDILDCMRRYVAAAEDEVRKARAIVDAGGEFDRRDLRSMEQNLGSMSRVIPWLEQPEPWGPPGEEADERMRREMEDEETALCRFAGFALRDKCSMEADDVLWPPTGHGCAPTSKGLGSQMPPSRNFADTLIAFSRIV